MQNEFFTLNKALIFYLNPFFSLFPFDSPENTRKWKVFWLFQEKSKRNFKKKWAKMKSYFVAKHKCKRRESGDGDSSLPNYFVMKKFG